MRAMLVLTNKIVTMMHATWQWLRKEAGQVGPNGFISDQLLICNERLELDNLGFQRQWKSQVD
jgi:hypothetical protein